MLSALQRITKDWSLETPTASAHERTVGQVIEELLRAKALAGCSRSYLVGLRAMLLQFDRFLSRTKRGTFRAGSPPISAIGLPELEDWMATKAAASRSTWRARLSALFSFAVRRDYMPANPCLKLEPIRNRRQPAQAFTWWQCARCLVWLRRHSPSGLCWFALSTFAGLRPEEAQRTSWNAIDILSQRIVRVEAQTSKVGQRRIVPLNALAASWLALSRTMGATLPWNATARRRTIRRLRQVLRWTSWPRDITRHTAASIMVATTRNLAEVALALGHSERILRRHYLALMTQDEARRFCRLMPGAAGDASPT